VVALIGKSRLARLITRVCPGRHIKIVDPVLSQASIDWGQRRKRGVIEPGIAAEPFFVSLRRHRARRIPRLAARLSRCPTAKQVSGGVGQPSAIETAHPKLAC